MEINRTLDQIWEESSIQNDMQLELINKLLLGILKTRKKLLKRSKKEMDSSVYDSELINIDSEIKNIKKELKDNPKQK